MLGGGGYSTDLLVEWILGALDGLTEFLCVRSKEEEYATQKE